MRWRTIARTSIGTAHLLRQLPCQDYAKAIALNDFSLGAIADGAGSARYAAKGAEIAVNAAVGTMLAGIKQIATAKCFGDPLASQAIPKKQMVQKLFKNTLEKAIVALQQQAHHQKVGRDEFACTLIAFIATPTWMAAAQVGDGFIAVRLGEDPNYILLFQPDKGEYANSTTFVTSSDAPNCLQTKLLTGKPKFICAATDGLENVALFKQNWQPHAEFFRPFENYLNLPVNATGSCAVERFLNSKKLNSVTTDDKSIILCSRVR